MPSKRLMLSTITVIIAALFFISPVLACNYPGPAGSSITVTVKTSDGTPIPGAYVTLYVTNGSKSVTSVGPECTGDNGQFTFPGPDNIVNGLTYQIHATYYGDTVSVECTGHSADSGTFSLEAHKNKKIDITIPGVTVTNGGSGETPTANPSAGPDPTVKPIVPKGDHASYPPMADGDVAGSVAGVILDASSGQPVKGAYVVIGKADSGVSAECYDSGMVEYSCQYTDSNGFFQFMNVNSTADAAYKLFVTNGCGEVVYSDPFKVGSGESVQINLQLGKKSGDDSPVISPTPTASVEPGVSPSPDASATATPDPSAGAPDDHVDAVASQSFIDQVGDFIGSLIASIVPK